MPSKVSPTARKDIFPQLIKGYNVSYSTASPSDAARTIHHEVSEFRERIKTEKPQILFAEIAKKLPGDQNKKFRKILRAVIVLCYVDFKRDLSLKDFLKLVAEANIAIDSWGERKNDKQLEDTVFDTFVYKNPVNIKFLIEAIQKTKRKISQKTFSRYHESNAFKELSFDERLEVFKNVTFSSANETRSIFHKLFYVDQPYHYSADEVFRLLTLPNIRGSNENYEILTLITTDALERDLVKDFTMAQILDIISYRPYRTSIADSPPPQEQKNNIFENFIEKSPNYTIGDVCTIIKVLSQDIYFEINNNLSAAERKKSWIAKLSQARVLKAADIAKLLAAFPRDGSEPKNKGRFFLYLSENKLDISLAEMLHFMGDLGANHHKIQELIIANFIKHNPRNFDPANFSEIKRMLDENFPQNLAPIYQQFTINEIAKNLIALRGNSFSTEDLQSLINLGFKRFSDIPPKIMAASVEEKPAVAFLWTSQLLAKRSISEFIDPQKLPDVLVKWGITPEYSMQRFFNLYSKTHGLKELKSLLTPNGLQEFYDAYSPNQENLIFGRYNLDYFLPASVLDGKLISCGNLCDFFDQILSAKIKKFSPQDCQDFQFPNPDVEKGIFGNKLKKLIANPNPSKKDVKNFFAAIIGSKNLKYGHDVNLTVSIDDYMHSFWMNQKDAILTLLQTNDGLATFLACCNTINHGCSANIGTQLTIAVYSALLQPQRKAGDDDYTVKVNPDALVFQTLVREVIEPQLSKKGEDAIGGQSNPLKLSQIKSLQLSPPAFAKKLQNSFDQASASAFIGEVLNDDQKKEEFFALVEEGGSGEEVYLSIAAYCALKASNAAAILKTPPLMDFGFFDAAHNKKMQKFLDEVFKPKEQVTAPRTSRLHTLETANELG